MYFNNTCVYISSYRTYVDVVDLTADDIDTESDPEELPAIAISTKRYVYVNMCLREVVHIGIASNLHTPYINEPASIIV